MGTRCCELSVPHNGKVTRPPALCAEEAPDEKLKINKLGPNYNMHRNESFCFGTGPSGTKIVFRGH